MKKILAMALLAGAALVGCGGGGGDTDTTSVATVYTQASRSYTCENIVGAIVAPTVRCTAWPVQVTSQHNRGRYQAGRYLARPR